jgi:tryptophan halogenase
MVVPFTTGIRKEIWHKNCLSLGLSSGFIEPLESTAIHLVYRTLDFFFRFFPDKRFDPALMAEFNRRITADYEEIKDFIVLHYCLTQRDDTPFWQRCKAQDISENLRRRIDVFKASGSLLETGPEELFKSASWYSVLDGMGILPQRGNLLADRLKVDDVIRLLDEVKPPLEQFVKTLPSHGDFVKSFCPAAEPV